MSLRASIGSTDASTGTQLSLGYRRNHKYELVKRFDRNCDVMLREQRDVDLASVRDFEAVAKLSDADRKDWQALWAEVDDLLGDKNKERSASR